MSACLVIWKDEQVKERDKQRAIGYNQRQGKRVRERKRQKGEGMRACKGRDLHEL
jgi:hypothetical protein